MNQNPASFEITRHFQAFLTESGLSHISVKNYVSDIRQFLIVSKISSARIITAKHIADYLEVIRSTKPEATYRRYLASIRRFITFLAIEYRLELPEVTGPVKIATTHRSTTNAHSISDNFKNYLAKENKTPATIKNYLSDLNHFLNWSAKYTSPLSSRATSRDLRDSSTAVGMTDILTQSTLDHYFDHLKTSQTSTSVINRRESTLRKFVQYCLDAKLVTHNPFEKHLSLPSIVLKPIQFSTTKHFKAEQNTGPLSFIPYLHLGILVLATTALGIFGYHQIFKNAPKEQAFPAIPVRPSRQLAFQGRLTDSSDNPISAPTAVIFKLFNQAADGNSLYQTNSCQVTPDQDGVFSAQIGAGNCGPEIGPEVFSENAGLFMEVTVGGQTLTPRQPIATAGYALNSETLQGYPASESATPNTVPVVDSKGQIGLGGSSPAIVASAGNFALKGNALTLTTNVGTDGNITIAPDGRGKVNINGGVDKGVFLHVNDANLTTGTLIEGYVGNNDPRGTLLHLASGTKMVNRLTVSTRGQTDIIAETYKNAAFSIKQTGTGPIFKALAGKTEVARLSTAGDLGLLGGLSLGSPYQTHAWPGQILTNINSRGMAGVIINQNDSGPILAASSSGLPRFVIANNGNVGINTINPTQGALVVVGLTWTDQLTVAKNPVSGYVLTSDNGGNATWQAPTGGGGTDDWTLAGTTLYPNSTTYNVLIGETATASAYGKLSVYGDSADAPVAFLQGSTTAAALIINNLGAGNLINASSSGVNKFTVANDGDITSAAIAVAGGVVWTDSTGNLNTVAGTGGQCLTSGGSGSPAWASCSSASNNYWQRNSGTLEPALITDDLLLGSISTASARIALINIAGGTPTASLSAEPTGATFLTATGTLATTNSQTLTLGNGTTGNVIIAPGGVTALTAIGNDVTIADDLTVAGADLLTTSTTFNLINATATTLNLGGAATTFNIGPTGVSGSIVLSGGSADTGCTLDGTTGDYTCSGNITGGTTGIQGYWQRADGSLTPTNITDSVNIGAIATASAFVHLAGTSGENSFVNTGNFGIGDTSPDAKLEVLATTEQLRLTYTDGTVDSRFTVDAAGDLTINNTGTQTIIADDLQVQGGDITTNQTTFNLVNTTATTLNLGGAATTFNIGPTGASGSIVLSGGSADTGCTLAGTTGNFTCSGNITSSGIGTPTVGFWTRNTASGFLYPSTITDSVGINTTSPLATLDVRSNLGTVPTASISGATSMAALIVDNSGVGDLFTASSSGLNRFVITQAGNVGIGTTLPGYLLDVQGGSDVQVATFSGRVAGDNAVNPSDFVTLTQLSSGSGPWSRTAPNVYLTSTTDQVGIGTATPVGKLQVINEVGTTSAASISATSSFAALVVDNNTGDIFTASSAGNPRFVIANNGNVGIGTVAPSYLLDVQGGVGIVGQFSGRVIGGSAVNANEFVTLSQLTGGSGPWTRSAPNVYLSTSTDQVGIGTIAPVGKLEVINEVGTTSAASISATSSFAALVIDQSGTGEIFTASSAGLKRLAITREGNLSFFQASTIDSTGTLSINTTNNQAITTGTGQITLAGDVNAIDGLDVTNANLTVGGANFSVNPSSGDVTTAGDVAVNGGDITTTDTTFNLLAGATTSIGIGPGGATAVSINLAGGSAATGCTVAGDTGNFTCSGNITSNGTGTPTVGYWTRDTVNGYLYPATLTDKVGLNTNTPTEQLDVNGNATVSGNLTFYGGARTIASRLNTTLTIGDNQTGNLIFSHNGLTGLHTTDPLATLDVRSIIGTMPVASISGATSMAALVVDNSGTGDLFTASSSGLNRFVITQAGNVGIGTTTPSYLFTATGSKTDYIAQIYNTDTTSSSSGLQIRIDGTGSLLNLNASGSDIVTITPVQSTFNNPTQFTSPGDVSIAYDLVFTNPTASFIKSAAPLTVASGETFNNDNLTLQTYGVGGVVISPANTTTTLSGTSIALSVVPNLTSATNSLAHTLYSVQSVPVINESGTGVAVSTLYNLYAGLTKTAGTITNYYGTYIAAPTGAGTVTNTYGLVSENGAGNFGINTTAPTTILQINSDSAATETISQASTDAVAAIISMRKSRGTNAVPSAVSAADVAGEIDFSAYNDAFRNLAFIKAEIETGVGASGADMPGRLTFWTSPDGSATPAERMRISNNGEIGINATSLLATLDVRAALGTDPAASISGATSRATLIVDNSYNSDIFTASSSGATRLRLQTNGLLSINGDFNPINDASQDMGIATTNEWRNIHLSNAIQRGGTIVVNLATQTLGDQGVLTTGWVIEEQASISGTLNTTQLVVPGITFLGCTLATCNNGGSAVMVAGNFGDGKIDVGTVDPPYTINGEKYATYVPGMIGQNEEVAGHLTTTDFVENLGYRYVIDFSDLPKASDLWLFSKVIDINKHISDITVMLTPNSPAKTWYELDANNLRLSIYSSKPTIISYRLTAPRFDSDKWTNIRTEGVRGFLIDAPDQPLNNLSSDTLVALDPVFTEQNINQYELKIGDNVITEIGSYTKLLVANLSAGFIRTEKLVSPIADIDTLTVNTLSAVDVSAKTLSVVEGATISGTLYATDIKSPIIDDINSKYASASAILASIRAKYSDFDSLSNPSGNGDPLTTDGLSDNNATISGELALYNQPVIITDTLLVNTTLVSNSLNSSEGTLYLQPTASAPINLLAGLMTLTPDGKVNINGDLIIAGDLYANNINGKQTITNQLNTTTATISGQLSLGKESSPSGKLLSLFNDQGDLVGAIDASGSARLNAITTNGLIIAGAASESATATSSATLATNATIGTGIISAGSTEIIISNSAVKPGTYIYLTPISDTGNQVLYLKTKNEGVGFTVSINQALSTDLQFNYWLIQTQP